MACIDYSDSWMGMQLSLANSLVSLSSTSGVPVRRLKRRLYVRLGHCTFSATSSVLRNMDAELWLERAGKICREDSRLVQKTDSINHELNGSTSRMAQSSKTSFP